MKRVEFVCSKCGREQYVDFYDDTYKIIEDMDADSISITCPCGGQMDVSAKLDLILEERNG